MSRGIPSDEAKNFDLARDLIVSGDDKLESLWIFLDDLTKVYIN